MKYFIDTNLGKREVEGKAFKQNLLPMKLFIHRKVFGSGFVISDIETGASVFYGESEKDMINKFYVFAECLKVFYGRELKKGIKKAQKEIQSNL